MDTLCYHIINLFFQVGPENGLGPLTKKQVSSIFKIKTYLWLCQYILPYYCRKFHHEAGLDNNYISMTSCLLRKQQSCIFSYRNGRNFQKRHLEPHQSLKQHLDLISKPSKEALLEQKALELQKKLATVQHCLNFQIKMIRFFKKIQNHRQNLKFELQRLSQGNVDLDKKSIEAYTKQLEDEQMNKLLGLMDQILNSDSFLKKKIQDYSQSIRESDKQVYKQGLLNESSKQKNLTNEARQTHQKMQQIKQIKDHLKEIEDQQLGQQSFQESHRQIKIQQFSHASQLSQKSKD